MLAVVASFGWYGLGWLLREMCLALCAEASCEQLPGEPVETSAGQVLVVRRSYPPSRLHGREPVAAFLERRRDYALEPTDAVPRALHNADGCLEMTPQQHGFDGSFAARLRRVA